MDFFAKKSSSAKVEYAQIVPWSEKYRPNELDQIIAQKQVCLFVYL